MFEGAAVNDTVSPAPREREFEAIKCLFNVEWHAGHSEKVRQVSASGEIAGVDMFHNVFPPFLLWLNYTTDYIDSQVKSLLCKMSGQCILHRFYKKGALAPRDALVVQLVQPPYDDYELFATIPFLAGHGNFTASDGGMVEIVVDFDLRHCFFPPSLLWLNYITFYGICQ